MPLWLWKAIAFMAVIAAAIMTFRAVSLKPSVRTPAASAMGRATPAYPASLTLTIAGIVWTCKHTGQGANVQTAALAGADTGGTQDIIYIIPQNEAILFEAPQREVFIRAEAPAANQLGVLLVVYSYFAHSFSRYAATAFQRINGTGTVPPTGF
jgi:hypothetical protein